MLRKLLVPLAVLCFVLAGAASVHAVKANQAPADLVIDDCAAKRAPVAFPHAKHVPVGSCDSCHHTQKGLTAESTVEVESCASCHKTPEKPETPNCTDMGLKKNIYHISCIACHKAEVAKDATKKLPVKCDDCHPKAG
ncbi:MAG TPA: cytochrome c3 family protein [Thermoanaerobaculia bacterium]|nr:cytochrome c3 family protein [Thermoanaerobaculia bacterium]